MKNKRPTSSNFESELSTWSLKKGNKLIITSNSSLAESTYRKLEKKMDEVVLLPHTETLPYDFFSPSKNIRNHRMQTLSKLLSHEKLTLITSIQALMSPCPDKTHLLPFELLETDQLINRKNFIYGLKNSGYERKDIVTEMGEYSLRGSIIDIYPTGLELPIRIEINNKKIESLRTFSPVSQLTIKRINSFFALPPQEYSLNEKGINSFKNNWRKAFDVFEEDSDIFKSISKGKAEEGTEIYLPLFFNGKITVISFLENFDQVLLDQNVEKELKEYQSLIEERFEEYRYDIKRPLLEPRDIFLTDKEYEIFLSRCEVLQIKFQEPKVKKVIKETRKLNLINRTPSHQILEVDDYVVHLFHGIGIFRGLKNIISKNIINECLEIEYKNDSKVYVPVESMHLVSKYFGAENISLDELGSKKWQKKKSLALKKTFDTAAELLDIQAKRDSKKGKKYTIPEEYKEFCKEFPFIETLDQTTTISEIENDLENFRPMDRLVCGEVGFGKTEVAMRASFLAAFNNSQI